MRWLRGMLLSCGWLCGATGCGSDAASASASAARQPVEVFYLLTDSSGPAFDGVFAVYQQQHPGGQITKTTASSFFAEQLWDRFSSGSPPDLFWTSGSRNLCGWVTSTQSYIADLDAFAAEHHWTDVTVMPQAVQDSVRCTGPDGLKHFYGVPLVVYRVNTLFYNRKVFADAGIAAPPVSIDEFFQVADTLRQRTPTITPFSLGTTAAMGGPWTLAVILFEGLAAGMHGAAWYVKFFSGKADLSSNVTEDSTKLRAVLEAGARLLDYVNPNFLDIGLADACKMLRMDEAAMTVTGDWMNGVDSTTGWSMNDSCDGRAAFGNMFGFSANVLSLSSGAKNPAGAMDVLSSFVTPEGQGVFNRVIGGIPPNLATLGSAYNDYARAAASDFAVAGDQLVPVEVPIWPEAFNSVLMRQLVSFESDRDVDALLLAIRNGYSYLQH